MDSLTQKKNLRAKNLDDTRKIAVCLARAFTAQNPGAFLLYGNLGAGKTTLVRSLVSCLPGGTTAEVASPSFTICNIYCTSPLIHHFDLYRLERGLTGEELEESLDAATVLTVVEWAERIADRDMPSDGLICRLSAPTMEDVGEDTGDGARELEFSALGPLAERCLTFFSFP